MREREYRWIQSAIFELEWVVEEDDDQSIDGSSEEEEEAEEGAGAVRMKIC